MCGRVLASFLRLETVWLSYLRNVAFSIHNILFANANLFGIDTHLESNLGRVLLRSVCNKYFDTNNCHDIWLVIFIKTRHVIEWTPTNHIIFTNNSLSEIDRHEPIHLIKIQFSISNIHCVFLFRWNFYYSKFFVFFFNHKIYQIKKMSIEKETHSWTHFMFRFDIFLRFIYWNILNFPLMSWSKLLKMPHLICFVWVFCWFFLLFFFHSK